MSDTASDFYHHKTEAELRFLIEHPEFYQPDLIELAKRELRRRGVQPDPRPVPAESQLYVPAEASGSGRGVGALNIALAGVLLLGLGAFYYTKHRNEAPAPAQVAAAPAKPKGPPRLTEVATSPIPNYDGLVDAVVEQQLARVPASEKTNPEHVRQFRSLCKRFWAAETQTEYLTDQAYAGKASPMFAEQALVVRQTWRGWNQAVVYHFKFGPVMQARFEHMAGAASSQQHILDQLPAKLDNRAFLNDKELNARQGDVQDWLSKLLPKSPVTGKSYKATVLKATL